MLQFGLINKINEGYRRSVGIGFNYALSGADNQETTGTATKVDDVKTTKTQK